MPKVQAKALQKPMGPKMAEMTALTTAQVTTRGWTKVVTTAQVTQRDWMMAETTAIDSEIDLVVHLASDSVIDSVMHWAV